MSIKGEDSANFWRGLERLGLAENGSWFTGPRRNRYTGENEVHNILDGIKEDELGDFNKTYNEYREKVRFQDNYKMFGNNNQRRIEAQKGKRNEVKLLGAEWVYCKNDYEILLLL